MESSVDGNTLTVRDVAPLDNGNTNYSLDEIIVEGYGNQPFPRDFYNETEHQLEVTGNHIQAMKQGLKDRGYNIK